MCSLPDGCRALEARSLLYVSPFGDELPKSWKEAKNWRELRDEYIAYFSRLVFYQKKPLNGPMLDLAVQFMRLESGCRVLPLAGQHYQNWREPSEYEYLGAWVEWEFRPYFCVTLVDGYDAMHAIKALKEHKDLIVFVNEKRGIHNNQPKFRESPITEDAGAGIEIQRARFGDSSFDMESKHWVEWRGLIGSLQDNTFEFLNLPALRATTTWTLHIIAKDWGNRDINIFEILREMLPWNARKPRRRDEDAKLISQVAAEDEAGYKEEEDLCNSFAGLGIKDAIEDASIQEVVKHTKHTKL